MPDRAERRRLILQLERDTSSRSRRCLPPCGSLGHVIVALQRGDLAVARQQIGLAMSRTDGCALRGLPNGHGPSRDWITTCAAQSEIHPLLFDAVAAIAP